jgi:hypothetical protein
MADPTEFNISFSIHGGDPKHVLKQAINNIIKRLDSLRNIELVSNKSEAPQYIMHIPNEYEQIGELVCREINKYNATANCDVPDDVIVCYVRIRTDENVKELFTKCVTDLIVLYKKLLAEI